MAPFTSYVLWSIILMKLFHLIAIGKVSTIVPFHKLHFVLIRRFISCWVTLIFLSIATRAVQRSAIASLRLVYRILLWFLDPLPSCTPSVVSSCRWYQFYFVSIQFLHFLQYLFPIITFEVQSVGNITNNRLSILFIFSQISYQSNCLPLC